MGSHIGELGLVSNLFGKSVDVGTRLAFLVPTPVLHGSRDASSPSLDAHCR